MTEGVCVSGVRLGAALAVILGIAVAIGMIVFLIGFIYIRRFVHTSTPMRPSQRTVIIFHLHCMYNLLVSRHKL